MNANHEEWKLLISQYIDDELSPEEKDTVHNHLVDCPACQKYLKELQTLSLKVKSLNKQTLSLDLEQRLNNLNSRTERSNMNKHDVWKLLKASVPVVVILFMITLSLQMYAQRSIQGRLRSAADDIGDQYAAGYKNISKNVQPTEIALKTERAYFPKVDRASVETKEKQDKGISWRDTATLQSTYPRVNEDAKKSPGVAPFINIVDGTESRSRGSEAPATLYAPTPTEVSQRRQYIAPAKNGFIYTDEINSNLAYYPYAGVQLEGSNREQYDLINENTFQDVTQNPLSTFSIDVDTASYSNVRRFLNNNQLPPRDAVRIEEMINYFKYDYPQPTWGQPFSITMEQGICPWNTGHQLVLVGLQGKQLTERQTPPSNLVFLIDVSGSMSSPDKLPLLKESLKMMVSQLRSNERISMVVYAGNAGLVLDSTPGYNKGVIMAAIDNLQSGGSTAGGQGIQLAYEVARRNFIANGNNRVILATDGDFNVGVSSDSELVQIIEEKRKAGIFLTVLGFGTGNLQDAKMEKLADKGNGNYFYIDSLNEGKKVLVDELGSTILAIAKDVKLQIEFNPKVVKSYRLIGYENRKLAKEDFNDDTKDAGELGAGHTVTALYEIVPAGSWETPQSGNVDPLKYQKQTTIKPLFGSDKEMMTVKLRYKEPKSETSQLITKVLKTPKNNFGELWYGSSANLQFASAVAEFGMLLRNSEYTANSSYQAVIQRAQNSAYTDQNGHKNEFIGLVQKAASLDTRRRPEIRLYPQPVYPAYPVSEEGAYNQK